MDKKELINYFNQIAPERDQWKKKNATYYDDIVKCLQFIIPRGKSVLEIGCGTGDLVDALKPERGVGIDISSGMVRTAREKYPAHSFIEMDAEHLKLKEKYDFVIMSDLIGHLSDVQKAFQEVHKVIDEKSRLIVTYYNFLWEPVLFLAEKLKLKMPQERQNWLNQGDIENLLDLADFEIIKVKQRFIVPIDIPVLTKVVNRYLSQLPFFRLFCIYKCVVARKRLSRSSRSRYSISVIIPARNEKGNIESAVLRMPKMGKGVEIIFVEGNSSDSTLDEIKRVVNKYQNTLDLKYAVQDGKGKGDAVRKGFAMATGDILCILDADLTVPPEELPKFYEAIASGRGEFINGSRLVYSMEKEAMRTLNIIGNKFFSIMFTWLLDQRFKDTLCGTKVIFKADYENLIANRSYFGEFDPFGDFDLIFGASKLNLKILEIPIRYKERTYGTTNISRFKHGLILIKMCLFAMKKIKFI